MLADTAIGGSPVCEMGKKATTGFGDALCAVDKHLDFAAKRTDRLFDLRHFVQGAFPCENDSANPLREEKFCRIGVCARQLRGCVCRDTPSAACLEDRPIAGDNGVDMGCGGIQHCAHLPTFVFENDGIERKIEFNA